MKIPERVLTEIALLIFDLDGTLADTQEDLARSVNAMLARMGLGALPHDLIASYVGQGVANLVRRTIATNVTEENVEKGIAIFLEHYRLHMLDHTVLYPGVREALDSLRGRKLAVLTNKPVRFSHEMLSGLGIAGYFSFVYGGNSFDQKKPDPVGVQKLMADTGVTAERTLIVGDSDTDVLTGRNAGVWTCGVTYGFGARTFETDPPDLLVSDLRELPPLLKGRKGEASELASNREQNAEAR